MTTELLHEVRDGVAYVTFNRPQARNALTFAMYDRLAEICAAANEDRSMRAILITGGGDKAFAAGTDISQFRAFDKEEDALAYEARIDRVMRTIERCRQRAQRLHGFLLPHLNASPMQGKVAEREGFEPPVPSRVQQISSRSRRHRPNRSELQNVMLSSLRRPEPSPMQRAWPSLRKRPGCGVKACIAH